MPKPQPVSSRKVVSIDSGGHRARVLAARDKLVVEHLSLVPPIAARIKLTLPPKFELNDLIAEGNFGLIRAATRYRPEAHGGTPFSAYARPRIRGAILDSVRRKNWIETTRISVQDIRRDLGTRLESRWDYSYSPQAPTFREQSIEGSCEPDVETDMERRSLTKRIREAIACLTPTQRAVIEAFFADRPASKEVVGAALGMSEYRVNREKAEAIAELRRRLEMTA